MESQKPSSEVLIWAVPGATSAPDGLQASGGVVLADLAPPEAFRPAVSITSLACGGGLGAFITAERRLYLLDLRDPPAQSDSPRIVQALRSEKVESVSCGQSHAIVVTAEGAAYTMDRGNAAELSIGRGAALAASGVLSTLQLSSRVVAAACGTAHVLIATETGAVFAFGDGRRGQLGLGDEESRPTPTHVRNLAHLRAVGIAAGYAHSCAVTSFGNLFVWGDNRHGQLGDGSHASKVVPQLITSLESVRTVVASSATAAISAGGSSFAWGFGGRHSPGAAFDRPVGRLALSGHVLCAISLNGELLLRALAGPSARTFLVQRGVAEVAAGGSHIVALSGPRPTVPTPPSQHVISPVPPPSPPKPVLTVPPILPLPPLSPTKPLLSEAISPHDPLRGEVAELEAANARLSMTLDEVRAESFFESARIQRSVDAATKRSAQAWVSLEKERGETAKADNAARVLKLQEELASLRAELFAEGEASESPLASIGGMAGSNGSTHRPAAVADAVAKDLREKHGQLSLEHKRLCDEREALQSQILSVRTDLADSGQRLKQIEDACVRTRAMIERQRLQMVSMQRRAQEVESELQVADERLPSAVVERARLEQAAAIQHSQRELLIVENAEFQNEEERLSKRLFEMQAAMQGQTKEHMELLAEARTLTQEHASEEQDLARQQFVCSQLEGEVVCLRTENAQSHRQIQELQQLSATSELEAQILADESLQECNSLRARFGNGGRHRAARVQATDGLRARLDGVNAEHHALSSQLHSRASRFAEETGPLYSEVQRLHAALSELRKLNSNPELSPANATRDLVAASQPQGSTSPHGAHPTVPSLRLGAVVAPSSRTTSPHVGAELGSTLPLTQTLVGNAAAGHGGSVQGPAAGSTLGWVEGEVSELVSQLQETARKREEIQQRLDRYRLGRA